MQKPILVGLISVSLIFFSLEAQAIRVKVESTAKPIMGLGFTVNGKQYGGLGSSYVRNDLPTGAYSFGVRAGSDIGCTTADGKKVVKLQKNSTAFLKYDGERCKMRIVSK